MTTAKTTTTVTCSVCLGTYNVHAKGVTPIRHGFTSHNVKHGQSGGWQTGACMGMPFPHLGISSEGTTYAVAYIARQIEAAREAITNLGANPAFSWDEMKYMGAGVKKLVATHAISLGDVADYRPGKPDYASLKASKIAKLQRTVKELLPAWTELSKGLSTWTAAKYAPKTVAKKGAVVHAGTNWGKARKDQSWTVAVCQKWSFQPTRAKIAATDAEVT